MSSIFVEALQRRQDAIRDWEAVNELLREFDPETHPLSVEELVDIMQNDWFIVGRETMTGPVVGMATLITYRRPTGRIGRVEDVIVAEKVRGRGIGRSIMMHIIEIAQEERCQKLNLTSRASRVAAHRLYQSLGFKDKETHVFQLVL